jgi:hypothetical protein
VSNLFERLDIDPALPPEGITERMRELCEDADPETRDAIRAEWEELTMHPERRLVLAFTSFPETRPPLGAPPPLSPAPRMRALEPRLGVADLAVALRIAAALSPSPEAPLFPAIGEDSLIAEDDA